MVLIYLKFYIFHPEVRFVVNRRDRHRKSRTIETLTGAAHHLSPRSRER
jgi:hypothetical protein